MKSTILTLCLLYAIAQTGKCDSCGWPAEPTTALTPISKASTPSLTGYATWYCRASARREGTGGKNILMANGKPLVDTAMTVALWLPGRPSGQRYRVTSLKTGKSVIVQWEDVGPGKRSRSMGVIADLTPAAMRAIAGKQGIKAGRIKIRIERI